MNNQQQFEKRGKAKNLMNELGKGKIPFLFIIDFEMQKPIVLPIDELESHNIYFSIGEKEKNFSRDELHFSAHPIPFDVYKQAFDFVVDEIRKGNSYLTNLTYPTEIETNISLEEIYKQSYAKYKLLVKNQFVVFSPECFIKINDGVISSYPMKGTIDADIPNAEEIIIKDEKEKAEHVTIVDLIRNDLSIVAKNVHVEKFRYVEKIVTNKKNLFQVSSKIVGELQNNYNESIGDLVFAMLPAGSISGAPKKKTVEIILRAENRERGYYTGVFGIFDGSNLDSAVMIRYIEKTEQGLFFRSGGGITFMSDANLEYQELIDKVYVPIT